uniref:Uncharacterized protein n=2 Tax=Nothobranchius kadleci TaxID=1051664 RepID=A0A1A8DFQ2_NOTKA
MDTKSQKLVLQRQYGLISQKRQSIRAYKTAKSSCCFAPMKPGQKGRDRTTRSYIRIYEQLRWILESTQSEKKCRSINSFSMVARTKIKIPCIIFGLFAEITPHFHRRTPKHVLEKRGNRVGAITV